MSSLPRFKYLIGLGNPGKEYLDTYHNTGAWFIDALAPHFGEKATTTPLFLFLKERGVVFVKPVIFMNESGKAIKKIVDYFKCKTDDLLVLHDDSDLMVGTYKFSYGRGAAGHRGVESVIRALRTKNFWRLRIGIRAPSKRREKAMKMVLRRMAPLHKKAFYKLAKEVSLNLRLNEVPPGEDSKLVRGRSKF